MNVQPQRGYGKEGAGSLCVSKVETVGKRLGMRKGTYTSNL